MTLQAMAAPAQARKVDSRKGSAALARAPERAEAAPTLRRCACGGSCPRCRAAALRPKLAINTPGDAFEREADRAADAVMSASPAPPPTASTPPALRRCACGGSCPSCQKEKEGEEELQREEGGAGTAPGFAPPVVHDVLSSPGRPLAAPARARMEAGFGADFSAVRVHDDARAAESARAVDAHAYTVGSDLVFAAGRYAPGTATGDRLLAHELAHTLQQGGVARRLQRACGVTAIGPTPPTCNLMSVPLPVERFKFRVNCDEFESGEEARLRTFAHTLTSTGAVSVVGMASSDGAAAFNNALSCRRAEAGRAVLASEGVTPSTVTATGPVPGTAMNPDFRAVGVDLTEPEFHPPKCGPDVTDWFVTQVGLAMADPAVLAIQADMAAADAIARRHGTTAQALAEGGGGTAVLAQEARMGSSAPARNPTITAQLGASTPGMAAGSGLAISDPLDAARIGRLLAAAGLAWRGLVNHGARYDFKAHVMNCPTTSGCPEPNCECSVTFCPSSPLNMCFVYDTPGNLFYALIGKFVGFSELTLQLGSQLAQLTGTGAWDPPEDTEAIRVGFALPLALTAANLCSTLVPERLNVNFKLGCGNCSEPTTAGFR